MSRQEKKNLYNLKDKNIKKMLSFWFEVALWQE